jgi:hypothetical protein
MLQKKNIETRIARRGLRVGSLDFFARRIVPFSAVYCAQGELDERAND